MPQVLRNRPHFSLLNTDGKAHPLENSLAMSAFALGVISLALGLFAPSAHLFAAIAGTVGFPLSLYSQLISATTGERWFNVIGMIGSFVGAGLALRHGGFSL